MTSANSLTHSGSQLLISDEDPFAIVTIKRIGHHFKTQSNQQLTSANSLTNSNFQLLISDKDLFAIVTKHITGMHSRL